MGNVSSRGVRGGPKVKPSLGIIAFKLNCPLSGSDKIPLLGPPSGFGFVPPALATNLKDLQF